MKAKEAGELLANIGAKIYRLADLYPKIEARHDFNEMMRLFNTISYELLHEEAPVDVASNDKGGE